MEKADIKIKIHLALVALLISVQKGTAFSTSPSALISCASSTANISYNFSIDAGETILGTRVWFFGAGKIAESDGTTLTPVPSYSSRLTAYGTSGISLSNITIADAGTYIYVIVLSPTFNPFTATTSLSVQVAPLAPPSGCQVSATQSSRILACAVNSVSGNCGTPSLNAFWVNSTITSNQINCSVGETYQCCATSAALTCYSGSSNDFCRQFNCTDVTTSTPNGTGIDLGAILGGIFGSLAFLGLCAALLYFIIMEVKKRQTKNQDKENRTNNSGSSSAVSRQQVQVQMENKGVKSDNEERPPAVQTRTQNKVDPSKQTKDRQQPVPPANTGFEDNTTFRPLPPPPQKGEIKDRNMRGISATIGDTPDLASETPRPNKLPPIPLKQETVQEENVSEEAKKKRKKKKKKDQMNIETPEEENGETDMRLN